jgi:hypothetical protein
VAPTPGRWRRFLPIEGDVVIGPTDAVKALLATKPVDFRKGAEGLAALVREQLHDDRRLLNDAPVVRATDWRARRDWS